ncbi:hypothetical protein AA313_de0204442 [Arthrobotrys entomopaga]|nr:hypothetical protein AA313_de0204442 [Arthrobotrys entomopaga]
MKNLKNLLEERQAVDKMALSTRVTNQNVTGAASSGLPIGGGRVSAGVTGNINLDGGGFSTGASGGTKSGVLVSTVTTDRAQEDGEVVTLTVYRGDSVIGASTAVQGTASSTESQRTSTSIIYLTSGVFTKLVTPTPTTTLSEGGTHPFNMSYHPTNDILRLTVQPNTDENIDWSTDWDSFTASSTETEMISTSLNNKLFTVTSTVDSRNIARTTTSSKIASTTNTSGAMSGSSSKPTLDSRGQTSSSPTSKSQGNILTLTVLSSQTNLDALTGSLNTGIEPVSISTSRNAVLVGTRNSGAFTKTITVDAPSTSTSFNFSGTPSNNVNLLATTSTSGDVTNISDNSIITEIVQVTTTLTTIGQFSSSPIPSTSSFTSSTTIGDLTSFLNTQKKLGSTSTGSSSGRSTSLSPSSKSSLRFISIEQGPLATTGTRPATNSVSAASTNPSVRLPTVTKTITQPINRIVTKLATDSSGLPVRTSGTVTAIIYPTDSSRHPIPTGGYTVLITNAVASQVSVTITESYTYTTILNGTTETLTIPETAASFSGALNVLIDLLRTPPTTSQTLKTTVTGTMTGDFMSIITGLSRFTSVITDVDVNKTTTIVTEAVRSPLKTYTTTFTDVKTISITDYSTGTVTDDVYTSTTVYNSVTETFTFPVTSVSSKSTISTQINLPQKMLIVGTSNITGEFTATTTGQTTRTDVITEVDDVMITTAVTKIFSDDQTTFTTVHTDAATLSNTDEHTATLTNDQYNYTTTYNSTMETLTTPQMLTSTSLLASLIGQTHLLQTSSNPSGSVIGITTTRTTGVVRTITDQSTRSTVGIGVDAITLSSPTTETVSNNFTTFTTVINSGYTVMITELSTVAVGTDRYIHTTIYNPATGDLTVPESYLETEITIQNTEYTMRGSTSNVKSYHTVNVTSNNGRRKPIMVTTGPTAGITTTKDLTNSAGLPITTGVYTVAVTKQLSTSASKTSFESGSKVTSTSKSSSRVSSDISSTKKSSLTSKAASTTSRKSTTSSTGKSSTSTDTLPTIYATLISGTFDGIMFSTSRRTSFETVRLRKTVPSTTRSSSTAQSSSARLSTTRLNRGYHLPQETGKGRESDGDFGKVDSNTDNDSTQKSVGSSVSTSRSHPSSKLNKGDGRSRQKLDRRDYMTPTVAPYHPSTKTETVLLKRESITILYQINGTTHQIGGEAKEPEKCNAHCGTSDIPGFRGDHGHKTV